MLDAQTFKIVIENTPLVSIDLCLIWQCYLMIKDSILTCATMPVGY